MLERIMEYYSVEKHEYFCEDARKRGLDVLYATDYDVYVDIDSKSDFDKFMCRAALMQEAGLIESYRTTVSSKRGNWHGICKLIKPLSLLERVALQCVLGSDLTREYIAVLRWIKNPGEAKSVLFEEKNGTTQN